MTNETKIQYLQRAGIAYMVAGLCYAYFGFPFWFLNAVDKPIEPFSMTNLFTLTLQNWYILVTGIVLFMAAYSLWKVGEPTGFGTKRKFFFVLMAGAICVFLCTWIVIPFAPLGALINAIGMILVGVASVRNRIWSDWKRYTPLLVGCFPFIFMYPLLILTGARPPGMIGLWSVPYLLLGIAVWQRSKELASIQISAQ